MCSGRRMQAPSSEEPTALCSHELWRMSKERELGMGEENVSCLIALICVPRHELSQHHRHKLLINVNTIRSDQLSHCPVAWKD